MSRFRLIRQLILWFVLDVVLSATQEHYPKQVTRVSPKVVIVSMYPPEAEVWYNIQDFNVLEHSITVPGLSPLYPSVHCTNSGEICQLTIGEGEINAATSMMALLLNPNFDLTMSYFMLAGIGNVNPQVTTTGSVVFARYVVQVALQYQLDAREKPVNFSTGYFPLASSDPTEYPQDVYGTEVFELSVALRDSAMAFARRAQLADSDDASAFRQRYEGNPAYASALGKPSIVASDITTADTYFTGALLGEAFSNTTKLFTNGTGVYGIFGQEDSASLGALLRGANSGLVDFRRIIVLRTCSDFDRPPKGLTPLENLLRGSDGYPIALKNIYLAGSEVVKGIMSNWNSTFAAGVNTTNYYGDMFNTLNSPVKPDFGQPSYFIN